MAMTAARAGRGGRFWLFAPFVLLGLVVVAWSAAWFLIRDRVETEIDGLLARESALGREWDCAGRRIGGFPFRIEISCQTLVFTRGDGTSFSLGRSLVTAQVYQPRHAIFEIAGPLRGGDGLVTAEGDWDLLEGSIRGLGRGEEQVSIAAVAPRLRVSGLGAVPVEATGERLEIYARPSPGLPREEGALDLVARASGATSPALDRLTGDASPANVEIQARVTQLRGLPSDEPPAMAANWRDRGGRLELALLDVAKGGARLQLRGDLTLDEALRPEGRVDPSAAGVEDLTSRLFGVEQAGGFGSMLDILAPRAPAAQPGGEGLRNFPPLVLRDGRVFVGPLPLPQIRLQPVF